ncbi:hypothetical protein BDV28DRAFT_29894 [Aspergillus coremiiformis]|uniref:G domain-containing protein n=1 Tax=Aspergillus coremiiformis TaxID=138285 RepID=A0A5N6YZK0_9EURO|nr:hypothetical protein BDV28DRAFT_29894 [Aspergillus coremiiformis]
MAPYFGRIIPRGPQLKYFVRRSPRQLWQLPGVQFSRTFFLRPVQSGNGSINETQRRYLSSSSPLCNNSPKPGIDALPHCCCPGCGGYAQNVSPGEPGYYSLRRKTARRVLHEARQETGDVDTTVQLLDVIQHLLSEPKGKEGEPKPGQDEHGERTTEQDTDSTPRSPMPICDRCHDIIHHNRYVPAVQPTIDSIGAYLDESPYKHNRIYHILDAADFPMSLIDNIYDALSVQEQRSPNRRAPTEKYRKGKKLSTISFVITRSDLLGPNKEKVDSKMEYIRSVLRDTLKQSTEDIRLGNVHMISAHRGWWTKNVKEEIKEHGNGIWVVGKANVGKSSFIEACFPKNADSEGKVANLVERRQAESSFSLYADDATGDVDSLLPPAPEEVPFPLLPVISSMSGTTASPIRIPFGRGGGEMIDLPGLRRGGLTDYVRENYKRDMIMMSRIKPKRYSVKPDQSLLIGGGLIRIRSVNPDDILMAASFVPIESHITNTEKALEMQTEQRRYPGEIIMQRGIGNTISSAGIFELKWDVTQSHLPKKIEKAVENKQIKMPFVPYRVMGADILIEGCGWIELTAQIRTRSLEGDSPRSLPQVEVFSPNGKHIGVRRPIECWTFIAEKIAMDKRKAGPRGRQSINRQKRANHTSKLRTATLEH